MAIFRHLCVIAMIHYQFCILILYTLDVQENWSEVYHSNAYFNYLLDNTYRSINCIKDVY